jgi:hypothetical protein
LFARHTCTLHGKSRRALQGKARPIELQTLVTKGTVDKSADAALPAAPAGGLNFPTQAQESAAEAKVAQEWSSVAG